MIKRFEEIFKEIFKGHVLKEKKGKKGVLSRPADDSGAQRQRLYEALPEAQVGPLTKEKVHLTDASQRAFQGTAVACANSGLEGSKRCSAQCFAPKGSVKPRCQVAAK